MEIWINPACSKCRTAQATLDEAGVDYTVRRYLDDPPSADELAAVLDRLGLEPWDVARAKEAREAGIDLPRDPEHRDRWLTALAAHPRALQRPIVTATDGTTVVGRDPVALARAIDAETAAQTGTQTGPQPGTQSGRG
ncbi:ArsC/Spx/MgsR family protein [Nocardioides pacificus]